MSGQRQRGRLGAFVLLSVLLHGAAVLAVRSEPKAVDAPPTRPLQLVEFEPAREDQRPTVAPPPVAPPAVRKSATRTPSRGGATTSFPAAPGPTSPHLPSATEAVGEATTTVPRSEGRAGLVLLPSSEFGRSVGTGGVPQPGPRGTTVTNGPGETPDAVAVKEYEGEVLTRKLNSELRQDVGAAAVAVGNVPAHFKAYEAAMRTQLPTSTIDKTPLNGKEVLAEVAGALFNEGPSASAQRSVADSPLGQSIQRQAVPLANVDDQRAREAGLGTMAAAENIKERLQRARLRTVLELTTAPDGALADVSIVERSGDPRFDESVMHFSRKVARALPDSDDKRLGTSVWKSRWQFTYEFPAVKVRLLNVWRQPN